MWNKSFIFPFSSSHSLCVETLMICTIKLSLSCSLSMIGFIYLPKKTVENPAFYPFFPSASSPLPMQQQCVCVCSCVCYVEPANASSPALTLVDISCRLPVTPSSCVRRVCVSASLQLSPSPLLGWGLLLLYISTWIATHINPTIPASLTRAGYFVGRGQGRRDGEIKSPRGQEEREGG